MNRTESPQERLEVAWHRLMASTVCRWRGHRFTIRKMSGSLCSRCRSFEHR